MDCIAYHIKFRYKKRIYCGTLHKGAYEKRAVHNNFVAKSGRIRKSFRKLFSRKVHEIFQKMCFLLFRQFSFEFLILCEIPRINYRGTLKKSGKYEKPLEN